LLFGAALLALVVAFLGPVERFAEELFWVHMVQHVLLVTVAAPLLVLSAPWMSMMRLLPSPLLRRVNGWRRRPRTQASWRLIAAVTTPAAVWIAFNANLVVWHVPVLFDLTLRNAAAHGLEHLLFLATGVFFWAQVIDAPLLRKRLDHLAAVAYISAAAVVAWILSIALTVAPSALYAPYANAAERPGGFGALADQRIAASVMLVPGSIAFLIAGLVSVHRWLDDEQRDTALPARSWNVPSRTEQPA
jgi:cytochrome c oxidase assembly factor CtaG